MSQLSYDAIVVGAGPNGLVAAITLQQAGLATLLLEKSRTVGGGMRTAELTLPGFLHDVCSAVHPMAVNAPVMRSLPLDRFGLQWIDPPVLAAHPFDDGSAAVLLHSLPDTAQAMGADRAAYLRLYTGLLPIFPEILQQVLGPIRIPRHPISMARFGLPALMPATLLSRLFHTRDARGLFAGIAAHSMQPLSGLGTSAVAMVLSLAGHQHGWPIPQGGSQAIGNAMAAYFESLGGTIETGVYVRTLGDLPSSRIKMLDVSPQQFLQMAGETVSRSDRLQLEEFRYGPGVFKIDWALSDPIPFRAEQCRIAGTVHLGGTFEEIAQSEWNANHGRKSDKPFVLLAQQSRFDRSRAPGANETAWAYCHVPNGSNLDMTEAIEGQIERFAPGFRDLILARHTFNPAALEDYNPNYIGGDINGGAMTLRQILMRPGLRLASPYKMSPGTYLCSASTPPGGGVHGQCGYHAARQALRDCVPDRLS